MQSALVSWKIKGYPVSDNIYGGTYLIKVKAFFHLCCNSGIKKNAAALLFVFKELRLRRDSVAESREDDIHLLVSRSKGVPGEARRQDWGGGRA